MNSKSFFLVIAAQVTFQLYSCSTAGRQLDQLHYDLQNNRGELQAMRSELEKLRTAMVRSFEVQQQTLAVQQRMLATLDAHAKFVQSWVPHMSKQLETPRQ